MKRVITGLLLIAVLALAPLHAQEADQGAEEAKPVPVEVEFTIVDADGNPQPGIIVQAQRVGRYRQGLTNKNGKCTLHLMSGDWVVKAIRLGERRQLLRQEVMLAKEELVTLQMVLGSNASSAEADSEELGSLGSEEISGKELDDKGREALAELDTFTNMVLQESLKKILGQLSVNDFTTSYWVEDQININNDIGISSEPVNHFQLDNDWNGDLVTSRNTSRGYDSLLSSSTALSDVPVNVNFAITPSMANRSNFSGGSPSTGIGDTIGRSLLRLPGSLSRMITGGEASPGEDIGYDLGSGQRQFVSSTNGFTSYYNEINNSIVNLYRPLRERFTNQVVSNTDSVRGVEFGVEKTFVGGLRATVFYTYSEAGGLDIRTVDLHFEEWQDFENFLQNGIRHDLSTNLEARFSGIGTSLSVGYKFFINDVEDTALREQVSSLVTDYSRMDVRLQQRINIGILSNARVSFNFAINNVLNSTRNTFISPTDLDEELTDSRKLLGGIKIEF